MPHLLQRRAVVHRRTQRWFTAWIGEARLACRFGCSPSFKVWFLAETANRPRTERSVARREGSSARDRLTWLRDGRRTFARMTTSFWVPTGPVPRICTGSRHERIRPSSGRTGRSGTAISTSARTVLRSLTSPPMPGCRAERFRATTLDKLCRRFGRNSGTHR